MLHSLFSLIVLIPKEGKDLSKPHSYRPTSLLDVDYIYISFGRSFDEGLSEYYRAILI